MVRNHLKMWIYKFVINCDSDLDFNSPKLVFKAEGEGDLISMQYNLTTVSTNNSILYHIFYKHLS